MTLIDGVILLPDNLFYNTSAAGVIVVLSKRKPAARTGQNRAPQRQPAPEQGPTEKLYPGRRPAPTRNSLPQRRTSRRREIAVITQEQAEKADYNLSPSRWVMQTDAALIQRPI